MSQKASQKNEAITKPSTAAMKAPSRPWRVGRRLTQMRIKNNRPQRRGTKGNEGNEVRRKNGLTAWCDSVFFLFPLFPLFPSVPMAVFAMIPCAGDERAEAVAACCNRAYASASAALARESVSFGKRLRRPPSAGEGPKAPWQSGDSAALPAQNAARRKPTPHPPTKSRRDVARGAEGGAVTTAPLRGLLTGVGMAEIGFFAALAALDLHSRCFATTGFPNA